MGGGGSSCYRTYEQKQLAEQRRKIRERKKAEKKAKHEAMIAERDAWLKYRRVGEDEMRWWNSGWWGLYKWLKEKQLWETELQRRKERDGVGGDYLPLRDHHE
jgi:sRNA-binding protein